MSTGTADLPVGTDVGSSRGSTMSGLRVYFASDSRRTVQTVLGLIWLLDGALQFQAFMYGKGFIQFLTNLTAGQPHWVSSSVTWGATTLHSHQTVFNTGFALVQIAIGLGLLYRPTVKPALAASFGWVLVVWWFGEAFGMMFMATTPMGGAPMASALTGAPGAVLLYALIGAMVWPNGRPGGLFGVRGARAVWAALWLVMAWLWLVEAGGASGITNAINAAPSGMSWLSSVQDWFANAAKGDGVVIAVLLAALSAVDRCGGRRQLAAEAVSRAGGWLESPLLGGRSGLRRHPSGRRDRPQRRPAVHPAGLHDVRAGAVRTTGSQRRARKSEPPRDCRGGLSRDRPRNSIDNGDQGPVHPGGTPIAGNSQSTKEAPRCLDATDSAVRHGVPRR